LLSKVFSSTVIGIDAFPVEVEVDIMPGLPSFTTVGLPETAVKESKERVKSAIKNSGYAFPDDRITVNLAPAHIKKEGTGFDLPIALGILQATRTIPLEKLDSFFFLGELSLDGRVKPVFGSLSMAIAAKEAGYKRIVVPFDNRKEASAVSGIAVFGAQNLAEVVEFLKGHTSLSHEIIDIDALFGENGEAYDDFSDVKGQEHVKRVMEIAAAGGHNVLMVGPPGAGKTMLARRLPSILPPITLEEAIETTKIYSVVGLLNADQALVSKRPFRSPHHTISDAGLIGGGVAPRPGEVSLAHNGVLFLDEFPEYKKNVLEVLRQPLEDHCVTISRAACSMTYPATFMLIAAMNPCPCGYATDLTHDCHCTHQQMIRYRSRISGPLLDRIDLHVEVPALSYKDLSSLPSTDSSDTIRQRVIEARRLQSKRFEGRRIYCNAQMNSRQIRSHCKLNAESGTMLEKAVDKLGLSARAYFRILKIARTIADISQSRYICVEHISEAIQYRTLDRK
jgi:magnesium chelatase family protein